VKISEKIIQYGWMNSLKRLFKNILRAIGIVYESYWFMLNKLDRDSIKLEMQKYDYSDVKRFDIDDFKNLTHNVIHKNKHEVIKRRLQDGNYICYGIMGKDKLIYSTWISTDKIVFSSPIYKTIPIESTQAILTDSYCHPDYRNKGLHSKMNLFRLKKIAEMGLTEAIVVVVVENTPAVKTQLKSGFHKEKKICLIKLFGKTYYIEKELI
jgi:hypothetical protein